MKRNKIYLFYISLIFISISCKKPYNPYITAAAKNYLVVEGVINNGNDSTFIKLSRTIQLANGTGINAEKGATVTVNTEGGPSFNLTEIKPGTYATGPLNLDNTKLYRLKIQTSSGQKYESEALDVKNSPPIDTIGYKIKNSGLQVFVNAHDPTNKTRYYRWDYVETWRFHSEFKSGYISNGTEMVPRTLEQDIYYCFNSQNSANIIIGSTAKLSQDIVNEFPIVDIPSASPKISVRYSILLKQYAISKAAYDFWSNLKKNTEQLGSIFDALPSEISGNIKNVNNSSDLAIGFVEVVNVQSKRIFINKSDLPDWKTDYPGLCLLDSTLFKNKMGEDEVKALLIPEKALAIGPITENNSLLGYYRTDFSCADCRFFGTQKQPAFWK